MSTQGYDYAFKIVTLGESGIGKTSLINRFTYDTFEILSTTINGEFYNKLLDIENKIIKIQLWDILGSECFRRVIPNFYRNASGAVVAYDISYKWSFDQVKFWIKEVKAYSNTETNIVIVGTKCDILDREVTEEEGKKLADELGVKYFETSAKTGYNVNEAYNFLIKDIFDNNKDFERKKIELKKDDKIDKKKRCSK